MESGAFACFGQLSDDARARRLFYQLGGHLVRVTEGELSFESGRWGGSGNSSISFESTL